ncbi:MAG: heparinase II/III family protein, partial [Armatimonadota bacterium]|nr:heparinase II/III family protein [Armatimonadota bacterium]
DGASHEGVGYWEYGVEYLLKFMYLARDLLGVNLYDHPWWKNTAAYPLYLSLPRAAWTPRNSIVDIADCPRSHWYGPDYLLRALAHEYGDSTAQWLAAQMDEANITSGAARWLNLVWFDPAVPARPPDTLPTLRHFDDMEIVSARSGWSGEESLVVLKCGPFIGHHGVQHFTYDPGGGHVHPDANHFVLFGQGEWLIRDDGYRDKWTRQHNTLLIDGKGQLGEGHTWFNGSEPLAAKARPRILRAVSTPSLDHMVGDATEAYPKASGLRRFVRHLLFLKPDVLIVADDILLDQEQPLQLRFHPESPTVGDAATGFTARGEKAILRLDLLTPEGVTAAVAQDEGAETHGGRAGSLSAVRLSTQRAAWRNAVALSFSAPDSAPERVRLTRDGERWTFRAGRRSVVLDWGTGEARAQP